MHKFFILVFLGLFISVQASSNTIYLVRHAEKAKGENPELTKKGEQRAQQLAYLLEQANVTHIYSTQYKRTLQTAQPLIDKTGLSIEYYDPSQLQEFAQKLKATQGNILVVGHSNTTPQLVELLSGQEVKALTEADYGDVYQVSLINKQTIMQHFQIPPIKNNNQPKQQPVENGVNYVKVSDRIDTSGQPPRELLQRIGHKKYDLIINLAPPQSHGSIMDEGGLVAQTGTRYMNIPVDWENPAQKDFEAFSHVLNGPDADKVLVHCQINMRGSLFTFLYRVVHEKIDPAIAHEKMALVWAPSDQWQKFAQSILDKNNIDFTLL
ncbi:MAG: histidine phosphatase family protein [Alcanivoracaceae bacterium]|nr:histidine phosphatase family protein [Alcanivoracaceae bacterium]